MQRWRENWPSLNCQTVSTTGPWTFSRIMPTALSTLDKYQQYRRYSGQHHSRLSDGPASYVVTAADLHPVHHCNRIFKFADDTYLVVRGVNTETCQEEIDHIQTWAADNNLKLNRNKTKEIVFSSRREGAIPPPRPDIERVTSLQVLTSLWITDWQPHDHAAIIVHAAAYCMRCGCCARMARRLRRYGTYSER